jgi:hypothetical protein
VCGNAQGTVTQASRGAHLVVACDKCGTEEQIHLSPAPTEQAWREFSPPQPGDKYLL